MLNARCSAATRALMAAWPDLSPDKAALIGVSGGRDSVALLHCLVNLGWKNLVVCHLDHGLRASESEADATFVRKLAAGLRLRFVLEKKNVSALAKKQSISIELAGRSARNNFFSRVARKHRTRFVFLAHHADDNAETILGNLFRGTGLAGLSGMTPSSETDDGLTKLRPLLGVRRSEIDAHVSSAKLSFREDSSNATGDHRRNRIRNEVLPLLSDVFGRDVTPIIARVSQNAKRDHACLNSLAREFARNDALFQQDGSLRITPELRSADTAIQSRILLGLLVDVAGCTAITSRDVDAAVSMLGAGGPAKINLPEGRHLRRKAKRLWVE